MLETWIDPTGDDFFLIHDEGERLESRPLGFGPPVYRYLHDGALIEVEPTVFDGLCAWKITIRGAAQ